MAALDKTKALLRLDVPLGLLIKNEDNPNKMSARDFDLLIDNFEKTGLTDAILVRPMDLKAVNGLAETCKKGDNDKLVALLVEHGQKFRIVGGHHRYDGASYLGFDTVPITVIMDPKFDEQQEKFQLVRMNAIRGKLDPQAFYNLYAQLSDQYSDEVLQDAFGFAEEAEFQRLIHQTAKMLQGKALQDKFKEAAKEIKTVDGLSKLLNEMFTKYGDTLPHGYMVFDHGGQRSMWLRIEGKTMNATWIGGEVVQYANATNLGHGLWRLDTFLRGLRGTERMINGHVAGERFVRITSGINRIATTASDIGQQDTFQALSIMATNPSQVGFTFTDTGNSCRPYTVKVYRKFRNDDGDVTSAWWPRVRQNGQWLSGADVVIPAKDTPETYSIDVLASDKVTVKATYSVSGALGASWTYTAAMQTTDYGSPQAQVYLAIYQISTVVGRGFGKGVIV